MRPFLEYPELAEFTLAEPAPEVRVLVRRGYEGEAGVLAGVEGSAGAEAVAGGRVPHPVVTLRGGERAVVRRYQRGGMVRHLNRERYLAGHRSWEELRALERARGAGVRVPLALAAGERREAVGYTATLATRWIPEARELAGWLRETGEAERARALREAGAQLARLHAAGVGHPDLNLRNFLVGADGAEVHLLDFDRARLYPGPVPPPRRARDLRRMARSARKLGAPQGAAEWGALRAAYGEAWPSGLELG